MEQFGAYIQKHKLFSYILGLGIIVFMTCFGFPIINLNKKWPLSLTATKIHVVLAGALFSSEILAGLFPKKKLAFIVLVASAAVGIGLLYRYLLEFGEVSNTYNFTLPNTLLHVGIFLAVTELTWLYAVRKEQKQK